jgi:DNA-binding response OmpR family regulator
MATILTVDDDEKIRAILQVVLTRRGHHVVTASSGLEAIEVFQREHPLVTILDLQMSDMNGLSVLQQIRERDSAACVIILTGTDTAQFEHDARRLGATEVLQKGFSLHTIGDTVSRVLTSANLVRNVSSPNESNTGKTPHDNRRKHPRMAVQLHAALSKGGVIIGDGEVVDLSTEGCALRIKMTVEQGDYLEVQLTLSDHEAPIPLAIVLAAVRWVHHPRCGLEFILMTPENQDRLRRYVKSLQDRLRSTAASS